MPCAAPTAVIPALVAGTHRAASYDSETWGAVVTPEHTYFVYLLAGREYGTLAGGEMGRGDKPTAVRFSIGLTPVGGRRPATWAVVRREH